MISTLLLDRSTAFSTWSTSRRLTRIPYTATSYQSTTTTTSNAPYRQQRHYCDFFSIGSQVCLLTPFIAIIIFVWYPILAFVRSLDVTYLESSSSGLGTKQRKRSKHALPPRLISTPQDFRRISSIVDADLLPETHRRVKLLKHASEKPLGFYIRDGTSVRVTPQGLERVGTTTPPPPLSPFSIAIFFLFS